MPRVCTVCRHPDKVEINQAIVSNEPHRGIAQRYGVSPSAVGRHKDHLPKAIVVAHEAQEISNGRDLLANVRHLREKSFEILESALAAGDNREALLAIREGRACLELEARVAGDLPDSQAFDAPMPKRLELTPAQEQAARKLARAVLLGKDPPLLEIEALTSEETRGS